MKNSKLFAWGAFHALGAAAYIFLVSLVIANGERIFGSLSNRVLGPIIFLLLFVFSALITGFLVLGRPLMFYLDGAKKEALKLFFYTALSLLILLIIAVIILLFIG